MRKVLYLLAAIPLLALVLITTPAQASAPHCTTGTFTENSGNGPVFHHVSFCDMNSRTNYMVVDGSPLRNRAVIFGSHVASQTVSKAMALATGDYPNPNGEDWHCQEDGGLYSWDCIASSGFLYGGMWAFVSSFYEHPNPDTDEVAAELYFNQIGPNGMTKTAQWRHRVIAVNDAAVNGLVEPFNWRVSMGDNNPPAPVTCLVLTGNQQGQQIPCTHEVQVSIMDYWHRAAQIPSQDAW